MILRKLIVTPVVLMFVDDQTETFRRTIYSPKMKQST